MVVHKAVSLPNQLARLWQSYCLNTKTSTECWRSNTRTTKTETSLFLNLNFFYFFLFFFFLFSLSKCLSCSLLVSTPSLPVDFFDSLFFSFSFFYFFFFFLILSWFHYFHYGKLANTKLHTDQGQKQHQVEWWEDKKGMETNLPQKIN
jgi:hypothetical protein